MHHQNLLSTLGKVRLTVVGLTTTLLVAGCGGPSGPVEGPVPVAGMPAWFTGPLPAAEEGVAYGRGQGESTQMRIARSLARSDALGEITEFQTVRVENLTRVLDEQMGTADNDVITAFTEAQKQVMAEELVGIQEANSEILQDGNMYVVYVMLEQDPGAVSAAIMARMREQQAAYARFRQSEVFEEMEREIERYEQRRRRNRR